MFFIFEEVFGLSTVSFVGVWLEVGEESLESVVGEGSCTFVVLYLLVGGGSSSVSACFVLVLVAEVFLFWLVIL